MFNPLKYDHVKVLKMPLIKKALPRYVKIVLEDSPARFQIAKRIVFSPDGNMSTKKMWDEHEHLMQKFHETQLMVDKGKLSLKELEVPRFSLLDLKIMLVEEILKSCELCERMCHVNRLEGREGFCKAGTIWKIFGAHAHYGEEPELIPSGTIFQAACSMRCVYCQNAPESIDPNLGAAVTEKNVAMWIEKMKMDGAPNINWVGGSPTCWLFNILRTLKLTDVNIAQIWNSNAYYSQKTAKLLDGIVDLYLLDFRYFDEKCAKVFSSAPNYPEIAKRNHLVAAKAGELLIRILVMPDHIECDAKPILKWIKSNLGAWTRINILSQYRPYFMASQYLGINRVLAQEEYKEVVKYATKIGLKNLVRG